MWLLIGFIGLLAGALCHYIVPANYRGGMLGTAIVGCVAALFGAFISLRVGVMTQSSGAFAGLAAAVLVLIIWRAISSRAA